MDRTQKMTCDEALRRLTAYLDQALSEAEIETLEVHLDACVDCCDKLQFSRAVDRIVKDRAGDEPLPDGFEQRIRRALSG